jgi:diaphanous 1
VETAEGQAKEIRYLQRALESVCARYEQTVESVLAGVKAHEGSIGTDNSEEAAGFAINSMLAGIANKDKEITEMKVTIEKLREEVAQYEYALKDIDALREEARLATQKVFD